jgi:hypothetical protein
MITAKDLRIGNYLLDKNKKIVKVKSIEPIRMMVNHPDKVNLFTQYPKDLKPIKITKEWLKALGFNNRYMDDRYDIFIGYSLVIYFHEIQTKSKVKKYAIAYLPNIKYVHQIQNYYYALCRKEIKVNLKQLKLLQ